MARVRAFAEPIENQPAPAAVAAPVVAPTPTEWPLPVAEKAHETPKVVWESPTAPVAETKPEPPPVPYPPVAPVVAAAPEPEKKTRTRAPKVEKVEEVTPAPEPETVTVRGAWTFAEGGASVERVLLNDVHAAAEDLCDSDEKMLQTNLSLLELRIKILKTVLGIPS